MPIPLFGDIGDAGSEWAGVFRQPTMDTNPDSMGHSFSSAATVSTGFGPGDYSGGYTGEGDRVYWGPYDDVSSTSSHQSNMGPSDFVPDFGPGYAVTHASSTGDTILMPPSQTTSVVAPASSTGDGSHLRAECCGAAGEHDRRDRRHRGDVARPYRAVRGAQVRRGPRRIARRRERHSNNIRHERPRGPDGDRYQPVGAAYVYTRE